MNQTRTMLAHIAQPTTCDVASIHRTWLLSNRARVLVHIPKSRMRCLGREESEGLYDIGE